jgi:hypothetical protein
MIHPTSADLLKGVEAALRETVLPELPRGTAARKQMQAALEILRHVTHALPAEAATLTADSAQMVEVLEKAAAILSESSEQSPPPGPAGRPPPSRGRRIDGEASETMTFHSYPLPLEGGGLGGGDLTERNLQLQQSLNDLQDRLPSLAQDQRDQITPLLISLHKRMTDRAVALIPPPKNRP